MGASDKVMVQAEKNLYNLGTNSGGFGVGLGKNLTGFSLVRMCWYTAREGDQTPAKFIEHGGNNSRVTVEMPKRNGLISESCFMIMDYWDNFFFVGNGLQTEAALLAIKNVSTANFSDALDGFGYKDDPDSTPRITGRWHVRFGGYFRAELSLIQRSDLIVGYKHNHRLASHFKLGELEPGLGFGLVEHRQSINPPEITVKRPFPLPIKRDIDDTADEYMRLIGCDCLAVEYITPPTMHRERRVINRAD